MQAKLEVLIEDFFDSVRLCIPLKSCFKKTTLSRLFESFITFLLGIFTIHVSAFFAVNSVTILRFFTGSFFGSIKISLKLNEIFLIELFYFSIFIFAISSLLFSCFRSFLIFDLLICLKVIQWVIWLFFFFRLLAKKEFSFSLDKLNLDIHKALFDISDSLSLGRTKTIQFIPFELIAQVAWFDAINEDTHSGN